MSLPAPGEVSCAVFVALREEMRYLAPKLKHRRPVSIERARGLTGDLDGVRVSLWRTGIGHGNARRVAGEVLRGPPPRHVLVAGFAGGLDPAWQAGDALVAERVTAPADSATGAGRHWNLAPELLTALEPALREGVLRLAHLLSSPRVLTTPADKRTAAARYDVHAVEMESAGVLEATDARSIPTVCVRAILDDHAFELPLDFSSLLTADGRPRPIRALLAVGSRPAIWPRLAALRGRVAVAGRALAVAVARVAGCLEQRR